jgi:MSHA pilin protein MshA
MKLKQQGFTLIELVVVITILAILAAIALPKFAALQADARVAKMNGALGAVKDAAAMAHGMLIARGFDASFTGTPAPAIVVEGTTVVYANGYPDSSVIAVLAGVASPDYNLPAATATAQRFQPDAGHATCEFIYNEAAANAQPTYTTTGLTLAACS